VLKLFKIAYIFDLDGTLVENDSFRYAIKEIPRTLGLDIDFEEFYSIFLNIYCEFVKLGKLKEAFDWDLITVLALRRLGVNCPKNIFYKIVLDGLDKGLVKIKDHAHEILSEIRERNGKIIVLTNGYRKYQEPVLRKTGLFELIHVLLTNDDLTEPKPSRKAFEKAILTAGISDPYKVIFIGDHPYYDIYGALNAGLRRIVWLTEYHSKGIYPVKKLAESIAGYAKKRYDVVLDLSHFYDEKIEVINNLEDVL